MRERKKSTDAQETLLAGAVSQDWSAQKIMHEVSDIATDPKLKWVRSDGKTDLLYNSGKPARFMVIDPATGGLPVRNGVPVKVIVEPAGEGIITAAILR